VRPRSGLHGWYPTKRRAAVQSGPGRCVPHQPLFPQEILRPPPNTTTPPPALIALHQVGRAPPLRSPPRRQDLPRRHGQTWPRHSIPRLGVPHSGGAGPRQILPREGEGSRRRRRWPPFARSRPMAAAREENGGVGAETAALGFPLVTGYKNHEYDNRQKP
jgi:hypothetical protein